MMTETEGAGYLFDLFRDWMSWLNEAAWQFREFGPVIWGSVSAFQALGICLLAVAILTGLRSREFLLFLIAVILAILTVALVALLPPERRIPAVAAGSLAQLLLLVSAGARARVLRRLRANTARLEAENREIGDKLAREIAWRMAARE